MRRAPVMMQHLVRPPVVTHEDAAWAMAEQGRTVSLIPYDAGTDTALGHTQQLGNAYDVDVARIQALVRIDGVAA